MLRIFNIIVGIIVGVSAVGFVLGRTSESLRVNIKDGQLVGRHLHTHNGRGIRAFMGIPYAEPPVGHLRFSEPVPIKPWTGEKHVKDEHAICIQLEVYRRLEDTFGSEDCLYLNVYTPPADVAKSLPVMVFFHGGGWQTGSGVKSFYGPDFLLDEDVILVTGNYRLGPLGFLSTGTDDCPGNNGLKDQVLILKWVQQNIAHFGGDPDSVTVFGESAGGATGTYLMMSPLAKGLFHRVISQSGTNMNAWAFANGRDLAPNRALKLGDMLGCNIDRKDEKRWPKLLKCLRSKSARDVTIHLSDFFEWDKDPTIPFPAVIEHNHPGAYITEYPHNVVAPHGLSIPLLAGVNLDEGLIKTSVFYQSQALVDDLNSNWDKAMATMFYYDHFPKQKQREITHAINEFYFKTPKLSNDNMQNFTKLVSDCMIFHGIDNYLRIRLEKNDPSQVGPTYVYLFAQEGSASFTEIFSSDHETYYGVSHADELQYLFPMGQQMFVSAIPTEEELQIRRAITKMWASFARTGDPTPVDSDYPKWERATSFPLKYYRIGKRSFEGRPLMGMELGLFEERAAFWNKLQIHLPINSRAKDEL